MKIYTVGHLSPDLDAVAASVEYAEFLNKSKRYDGINIVATIAGSPNKETQEIFKKFNVEIPPLLDDINIDETDAFILVDHNEESQRHPKISTGQILEIIDHHKINISFTSPIRLDVKPLGSTSTLIYEQFDTYSIKPSEHALGLILASILSDTQGLKASTTTGYDSDIAHRIATELDMDIEKFTFEIFKAKSDISGLTIEELATKDYKIFDFGGKKVLINQVETVEPDKIIEMKAELVNEMNGLKTKLGASQTYTIVTDILNVNSHAIYTTEEEREVIEKAFTTQGHDFVADIGPRMSRKKDIAPEIEKALK